MCVCVNQKNVCREGMKKVPLLAEVKNSGLGMDYIDCLNKIGLVGEGNMHQ